MKKVYFISGLGADERAFSRLDLAGITPHFIQWKIPIANETLEAYATRLAEEITEPDPILVGLSFGGVVAIEIAKQRTVKKIILISSIKTRKEMPLVLKLSASLGLHKLIPISLMAKPNLLVHYFFGVRKHQNVKQLLDELLLNSDTTYTKWSIHQLLNWKNETLFPNMIHIHGTRDKVFPIKNVKPDYTIEGGSHFMVWTKAKEVSEILQKEMELKK